MGITYNGFWDVVFICLFGCNILWFSLWCGVVEEMELHFLRRGAFVLTILDEDPREISDRKRGFGGDDSYSEF